MKLNTCRKNNTPKLDALRCKGARRHQSCNSKHGRRFKNWDLWLWHPMTCHAVSILWQAYRGEMMFFSMNGWITSKQCHRCFSRLGLLFGLVNNFQMLWSLSLSNARTSSSLASYCNRCKILHVATNPDFNPSSWCFECKKLPTSLKLIDLFLGDFDRCAPIEVKFCIISTNADLSGLLQKQGREKRKCWREASTIQPRQLIYNLTST